MKAALFFILYFIFMAPHYPLKCQTMPATPPDTKNHVSIYLDQPPTFPGGGKALSHFMADHMTLLKRMDFIGSVIVEMVIDTNGNIVSAIPQCKNNKMLTKWAMNIVKAMPKWNPGVQNGQKVKSTLYLPIIFDYKTFEYN